MTATTSTTPVWADPSIPARDMPAILAACRRGLGKPPGTVPEMWALHRLSVESDSEGARARARFDAEHHTLTLWSVHQQGQVTPDGYMPVHARDHPGGVGIGNVIAELHRPGPGGSPPFNESAVERRFHRTVVAPTVDDLAVHLRGLLTQVRALGRLRPCNYDRLFQALATWHLPDAQLATRREWGRQYQRSIHQIRNRDDDPRGEPA
jgi:CRISPR system Cascade subunit CasB